MIWMNWNKLLAKYKSGMAQITGLINIAADLLETQPTIADQHAPKSKYPDGNSNGSCWSGIAIGSQWCSHFEIE